MEQETTRLVLKAFADNDRSVMLALFAEDAVKATYMLPDFASEEEAARLFSTFKRLSEAEDRYVRGIYRDGILIGWINDVGITKTSIELGWVIAPDKQNRGYATEAVKIAVRELFQKGFSEVTAGAFAENKASIRVMEKVGMTRLGRQETLFYRGHSHVCDYYAIQNTKGNHPGAT